MKSKTFLIARFVFVTLVAAYGFAQSRVDSTQVSAPANGAPRSPTPAVAEHHNAPGPDLILGSGDLVEVNLYGMPDFKTDVRINSAGEISVPLLGTVRSEEHTSELQSRGHLVCRLLLE